MRLIIIFALLTALLACKKDTIIYGELTVNYPSYFPEPVYTFQNNEVNAQRFALGKKLFFDKNLSKDGTISCASCHAQSHGFADHNVSFSAGVNGALGNRNSPSIANMIWSPSFMWDGGVNHIEVFSVAPITNPVEMKETMANVVSKLNANGEYRFLFKEAYGLSTINDQAMLRALTVYMSMIISCNSKYDKVRQGKATFSSLESTGYGVFQSKCASCHTEPLFSNYGFINNGLDSVFNDLGRAKITFDDNDKGKFKVPSLRNVTLTYPYMHDGRFWTLDQVLDHYSHGIVDSPTLDPSLINGISLTEDEKTAIKAFLATLKDNDLLGNKLFY
jgi:cytochrome c peroxidase